MRNLQSYLFSTISFFQIKKKLEKKIFFKKINLLLNKHLIEHLDA